MFLFHSSQPNVSSTADDLESLLEVVVHASNRGVPAAQNVSGGPNWSFGQSLFFSSTVVTTIGKLWESRSPSPVIKHPTVTDYTRTGTGHGDDA